MAPLAWGSAGGFCHAAAGLTVAGRRVTLQLWVRVRIPWDWNGLVPRMFIEERRLQRMLGSNGYIEKTHVVIEMGRNSVVKTR